MGMGAGYGQPTGTGGQMLPQQPPTGGQMLPQGPGQGGKGQGLGSLASRIDPQMMQSAMSSKGQARGMPPTGGQMLPPPGRMMSTMGPGSGGAPGGMMSQYQQLMQSGTPPTAQFGPGQSGKGQGLDPATQMQNLQNAEQSVGGIPANTGPGSAGAPAAAPLTPYQQLMQERAQARPAMPPTGGQMLPPMGGQRPPPGLQAIYDSLSTRTARPQVMNPRPDAVRPQPQSTAQQQLAAQQAATAARIAERTAPPPVQTPTAATPSRPPGLVAGHRWSTGWDGQGN